MKRSREKELIDTGQYAQAEYNDCLGKLFSINCCLGIYRDTLQTIRRQEVETIADVGCGGGDFLVALAKEFPRCMCVGTDISENAIAYANSKLKPKNVNFLKQKIVPSADIVIATLVCHHLYDEELIAFVRALYISSKKVIIINDLQRSRIAYYAFKLLSWPIFQNRLISHDGPLSVLKGFTKKELLSILKKAEIPSDAIKISWRFPFRWHLVIKNASFG